MLKVWTTKEFLGHYPVGTAAVIVAKTQEEAYALLKIELMKLNLWEQQNKGNHTFLPEHMEILKTHKNSVLILNDGNY